MINESPNSLANFRARSGGTVFVHRLQRCACGKCTSAKQLTQYGACVTCVREKDEAQTVAAGRASDQTTIGVAND